MEMNWPVFMYSEEEGVLCSIKSDQLWTRRALKNTSSETYFLDSSGRHFCFDKITDKKMSFPTLLDLIDLNPKYKVKLDPKFLSEFDLIAFKEHILKILMENRYTLESSGDPDEIMQKVKKAESCREIIEMFL